MGAGARRFVVRPRRSASTQAATTLAPTGSRPTSHDLKGLRAWRDEHPESRCLLVSGVERARKTPDGIEILPWSWFLRELSDGGIHPR